MKTVQVLYNFRNLIDRHLDELTRMVCAENGKVWDEAQGDVLKAKEVVELACGVPSLMMGESLMNASPGYDTVLYREPLGVFAGIAPFNFPAMIPMGWMMPLCIATGNTFVLKAGHHDSHDLHADDGAAVRSGAAAGRGQPGHLHAGARPI